MRVTARMTLTDGLAAFGLFLLKIFVTDNFLLLKNLTIYKAIGLSSAILILSLLLSPIVSIVIELATRSTYIVYVILAINPLIRTPSVSRKSTRKI